MIELQDSRYFPGINEVIIRTTRKDMLFTGMGKQNEVPIFC